MLQACLQSVVVSQLTVQKKKYHTVSIGLQESCKPVRVELFKAGSIGLGVG